MTDSNSKKDVLPQRLCSEIQLFDLCDLDSCKRKDGRYCTDPELISRFEKISEEEIRTPERFVSGEVDEEADDDEFYGDNERFSEDDYDSEESDSGDDEE